MENGRAIEESVASGERNEQLGQQSHSIHDVVAAQNDDAAPQQSVHKSPASYAPAPPRSPVQARLHESFASDRRYLREMVDSGAGKRSERVEAVLSLKSSLESSSSRIASQNAVRRRREELQIEQDARAHEALLSQGLNPYEVTRRREVTLQAERKRAAIELNIRDKQMKVLQNLEIERVQRERQEKLAEENRAYEKKYQREMGRAAAEERVQAYIISRTGKDALDPTGKAVRIYPSQEALLKDNSFGLGKNLVHTPAQRKVLIDKVRGNNVLNRNAGPSPMLLPRQKRALTPANDTDEADREARQNLPAIHSAKMLSLPLSHRPGEDLLGLNHTLLSHSPIEDNLPTKLPPLGSSSKAMPPPSNQRQQSPDLASPSSPLKKARTRSVLEEKMLADVRRRQRDGACSNKQVVWGREFVGEAFRADPPSLWFKDFEAGKPMILSFTLTNVSNTFNQFKLLEIEHMSELFDIRYERPGRMSAGMTCGLTISFSGDRQEDIETWLPVAAPTGITKIPVKCTCKKAVPVLSTSAIRFVDVVAGETQSISLRLENKGALPFKFRVQKIASSALDASTNRDWQAPNDNTSAESSNNECPTDITSRLVVDRSEENAPTADNPQEATTSDDQLPDQQPEEKSDFVESEIDSHDSTPLMQEDEPLVKIDERTSDLSEDEILFVRRAQSMIRFEPAGFDTPITFKANGLVPPYSTIPVTFTFSPSAPMKLDAERFQLAFYLAKENEVSNALEVGDNPLQSTDSDDELLSTTVVVVSAKSTEVPIYVAHDLINIECCAYQKLYRAQLLVGNRGKVALKMQIKPPKSLVDVIEFHPNEAFVQAAVAPAKRSSKPIATQPSFIAVQIKFRPRPDMWEGIERKGLGSKDLGMLAVPIRVLVPDQRIPVHVILVARISTSKIELDPETILFGDCCLGHSVTKTIMITNQARVPQRIAVTTCPPEIVVSNDDRNAEGCADGGELVGAGVVLHPLESRRFNVVYQPTGALPLVSATRAPPVIIKTTTTGMVKPTVPPPPPTPLLVLRSSTFNQSYPVVCSGMGVASPLVFSKTTVFMGATQIGQTQLANVLCTNMSDRWIQMELRLPPEAFGKSDSALMLLRVSPQVTTLGPKQCVRIEFEFFAREDVFDLIDRPFAQPGLVTVKAGLSMPNEVINGAPSSSDSTGEPSVRVKKGRVDAVLPLSPPMLALCDLESRNSSPRRLQDTPLLWSGGMSDEPRSCHITWNILCFRRVDPTKSSRKTPRGGIDEISLPLQSLTLRSTVLGTPQVQLSAEKLDFGQVALGQSTRLTLSLTNNGTRDLQLRGQALHALGAFRVINSTKRTIKSNGGLLDLYVEFAPQSPALFDDTLELIDVNIPANCPTLRIPLRGLGVNPSLIINPQGGDIDFMDVLARSRSVFELTLTNTSGFPLNFAIVAWHESSRESESKRRLESPSVSGLSVFSFSPTSGTIAARGSLSVKAAFHPDHSRPDHYSQKFRVQVPNESECHLLSLSGRCWENQLYVFAPSSRSDGTENAAKAAGQFTPPTVFPAVEDLLDIPPSVPLATLMKTGTASVASPVLSPLVALAKAPTNITITLDGESLDSAQVRRFFVGSTLPPPAPGGSPSEPDPSKTGASYSFELVIDGENPHAKLFTVEPMKGSLSPGQQLEVSAKFHPPARKAESSGGVASAGVSSALAALFPSVASQGRPELDVSQWVELRATCTLRGGFMWRQPPPPPLPSAAAPPTKVSAHPVETIDTRVVTLVLRAKLQT